MEYKSKCHPKAEFGHNWLNPPGEGCRSSSCRCSLWLFLRLSKSASPSVSHLFESPLMAFFTKVLHSLWFLAMAAPWLSGRQRRFVSWSATWLKHLSKCLDNYWADFHKIGHRYPSSGSFAQPFDLRPNTCETKHIPRASTVLCV